MRFFAGPAIGLGPSARAIQVLVVMALVSLVIGAIAPGAWTVAPAAGMALLVLVLIDGWLAGGLIAFDVTVPRDGEVGEPLPIRIDARLKRGGGWTRPSAALATSPRLADGGRIDITLDWDSAGAWQGHGAPAPVRRGTGQIERGWLRWQGPLGLAHRQAVRTIGADVRVWPNLAPARGKALQIFLREAGFGRIARAIRGGGQRI